MESNQSIVQVETSGNFERQFRGLFKRYRKIRSDVQPIIEQLQSGEVLGDRLSGLNIFVGSIGVSGR
jgi:mRNA-degrading endonuclease YafQ of YafQ-DinJ toxin-antitoxin module